MLPNPGPGRFIAIEGLDGAGTTTQVRLLGQRLAWEPGADHPAYLTYEPTDGPIGLQVRLVLQGRVAVDPAVLAALFAADRLDHLYHREGEGGIVTHLADGGHVVTDRYYLSSFAYQGMQLDWEWIWHMHEPCIRPDVTLFVDVPVEVCLERIARGRGRHYDLYENRQALTRVRQSYLDSITRLRQAGDRVELVDGDAPPEQVHATIWQVIQPLF